MPAASNEPLVPDIWRSWLLARCRQRSDAGYADAAPPAVEDRSCCRIATVRDWNGEGNLYTKTVCLQAKSVYYSAVSKGAANRYRAVAET